MDDSRKDSTSAFEKLLTAERGAVERFVRFRLHSKADADDVLQEIYFTACRKFSQLKNRDSFKAWLISIARNKCNDYFRREASRLEIPIDELAEKELAGSRHGIAEENVVRDTLELLGDRDKQILYLYFWKELPRRKLPDSSAFPWEQ